MRVHFIVSESWDWVGTYFDGRLVHEGHNITAWQLAEQLRKAGLLEGVSREQRSDEDVQRYSLPRELGKVERP